MIRLLHARDYQRNRWKNDGGWTTEIASEPMADAANGFRWRVSIAEIETDGPFSQFTGVERDLLLLSGKGIELDRGDAPPQRLDQRFQRIHFRGEDPIQCRLLAGPTRDFNVMCARGLVCAEVNARPLNGTMLVFVESAETWLIHVFSGSASARSGDQSVHAETAATLLITATSDQRERVVIEGGGELIFVKFVQLTSASESA